MQPGTGTTVTADDATVKISTSWNNYFRALTAGESVFTAWSCHVRNRKTKKINYGSFPTMTTNDLAISGILTIVLENGNTACEQMEDYIF